MLFMVLASSVCQMQLRIFPQVTGIFPAGWQAVMRISMKCRDLLFWHGKCKAVVLIHFNPQS